MTPPDSTRCSYVVSVLWSAPSSSRDRGVFGTLLVSLSWYKPGVRLPPRVAIAGSNRGFSRLDWSAEPTLLSLLWYKPGGKLTCRNSKTARNDSDQLGLDPVVIHVSQPLLVSLACCGRPRHRVVIAGPNRSGCGRPPSSCRNSKTAPNLYIQVGA